MKNKLLLIAIFLFTISLTAQTKSWGNSKIKIGTIPAVTEVDSILVPSPTGIVQHITYSNFFAKLYQDLINAGLGGGTALTFTSPLSETGGVVSMTQAGLAQNGWISSVDFNTFNNKVSFPGFTSLLADYGFTETDPIYSAWDKSTGISIIESQISNLNHTVDTDTHIDQAGIEAFGFVTGAHTVDTNTQLSQAEVGTYAANEGFIKTWAEVDPVWMAEESNVPRLNTSNTFTDGNTMTTLVAIDNIMLRDGVSDFVINNFGSDIQINSASGQLLINTVNTNVVKIGGALYTGTLFSDYPLSSMSVADIYSAAVSIITSKEYTQALNGLNVDSTDKTVSFSQASTSTLNNIWLTCTHATTDITVTLDQGIKDRTIYFEQGDAAQVLFVAGTGVTLTYTALATTPKTRDKGSVVAAVWKSTTLIHLVGALEDN